MGRITIFSADGCPHSRHIKTALNELSLPFCEISVTLYPEKRQDMVALADRLSTPQVFFNTRHVGGVDETLKLLREWQHDRKGRSPKDRYHDEIAKHPDPINPRFALPTGAPVRPEASPSRGEAERSVELPDGFRETVLDVTETLKKILPLADRKYNLTVYANCVTGHLAVEALAAYYRISREQAVAFGRRLQQANILDHVVSEHEFEDAGFYYRLHCHQTPDILNSYRVWTETADPDPMRLITRLRSLLSKIEYSMTDAEGFIDYERAPKCPVFPVFEEAICELQKVDLFEMNDTVKTAFGINLYNLMIVYAFMKVGVPNNVSTRNSFFTEVKFNVGGFLFNFQDWENGVLRGNRKAPHGLGAPFSRNDPRRALIVTKPDPRIHFGLNCGAKSCPPVNNYTAESLDEELRIVAQAFCEHSSSVDIDAEKREITLSKIFSWYRVDFCDKTSDLPRALLPYLRGVKRQQLEKMLRKSDSSIKVSYGSYDWSTQAKAEVPFDATNLKANRRGVKTLFKSAEEGTSGKPKLENKAPSATVLSI